VKFCFDIDGVLATKVDDLDYTKAKPIQKNIDLLNHLAAIGHTIILYTARGSETGIDWHEKTAEQMRSFGVQYQRLVTGKPAADYYIDDRMMSLADIDTLAEAIGRLRYVAKQRTEGS